MNKTIKMESAYDNIGGILIRPVIYKSFELVPAGTKLDWSLVNRLHNLKYEIPFLYIDDSEVVAPKREVPKLSSYTINELYSKIRTLMSFYSYDTLEDVEVVMEIIESTIEGLNTIVDFDLDEYLMKLDDIYSHTLNTTVISTLLAIKSGQFTNMIIQQIALGALLHDIGYLELCKRYGVETIEDLTPMQCREHPVVGYELVDKDPYISDVAKKIILMHHYWNDPSASWDSKQKIYLSYPSEYKSMKIPVWSKSLSVSIVHVSSDFEHFVNPAIPGHVTKKVAIKRIVNNRETVYGDAALLLAQYISPYSVGDRVKLSNGKIALVSGMTQFPARPVISIGGKQINLSKNNRLTISGVC